MISEEKLDHIRNLADTLCTSESLELVFVEHQREVVGRVLRFYIDKPGGVGIDDCTRVSRQLGDLLDIYLEGDVSYHLEVTSPGPQRPLGKEADFERFSGKRVKIKTREGIDGKKKFSGKLLGIQEGLVKLEVDGDQIIRISHKDISQARLVINDGDNNKCL